MRAALFHDLDRLEARVDAIHRAGPEGALHAIAIKANPLVELLRRVVAQGAGLEAASWEEVTVALAAGCPADRIVFDGPAKTEDELRKALELGVWLNADSGAELARLEALGAPGEARIGLRVNPQLGAGAIAITSTVSRGATFGVPIDEAPELLDRYPFVTGLHVHTGSQGVGLPDSVEAQLQGSVQFGLTAALYGRIDIEGGGVKNSNFHDYPMVRMADAPKVEVTLLSSPDATVGGAGEPGVPPVAPAVANAMARLGKRPRTLPIVG